MKQSLRVIGGQYRGMKIPFAKLPDLRPTPDRVRETLFNWLMPHIHNARCLDAFAGSGALGIEARSRGAQEVLLIEKAPLAREHLKQAIERLKAPHLTLLGKDILPFLAGKPPPFDIIFLDPPFKKNIQPQCVQLIEGNPSILPGGFLYIESPEAVELDPSIWECHRSKKSGQVYYALFRKR